MKLVTKKWTEEATHSFPSMNNSVTYLYRQWSYVNIGNLSLTFTESEDRQQLERSFKKVTFALKMLQLKTEEVNCLKSQNQFIPQLNVELYTQ